MNRTCNELGVCQGRTPACAGCTAYPFAPGVIDGYPKPRSPALSTWLVYWVYLMLIIALTGYVAGKLS